MCCALLVCIVSHVQVSQIIKASYEACTWAFMWRFLMDRFPVLEWMPKYTTEKFLKDLQAGVVVGCMLIPQGMGYADVAGIRVYNT